MAEQDEYNASKIVVLEGTQGIRKRPAMYIGSTGVSGVVHLVYEAFDNAVDEAMAGYCKNIMVHLQSSETGDVAEVSDNGRGIPVDAMKGNRSALEVIMTSLHSGAKFSNDVYKTSGGLHGVGLTVINSLSEFTEVTVKKDGRIYKQSYSRGVPISQLEIVGDTEETGTTIRFKPDPEIFKVCSFESGALKDRMKYTSFLHKGLKLTFIDDRFGAHEQVDYYSENGVTDFIRDLNTGKTTVTDVLYFKKEVESTVIEFALQYNDTYDERLSSYVNNIYTPEGGSHLVGFRTALTRAILNYCTKNIGGKTEVKLSGDDVREGLVAVVSILMSDPEFEGQTKEKLGSTKIKSLVETMAYSALARYFEEHPADAKAIVAKALNAAMARESAKKARELVRRKNALESSVLPGKLVDCIESDTSKTEIFIVEGQSAGGSAKEGRNKNYQAILPLRGKILNVEKANVEKVFQNQEIKNLITAIGGGVGESFNVANIRYGRLIIMSDADVDGSHICTLLLTFFYRYMRKAIENGNIYIAQPPLYRITKGKEMHYCYSDDELERLRGELGDRIAVQRYKGLGEMDAEQLWDTTMNPEARVLKKITIKDAERVEKLFVVLMGVDVQERRKFLEEHAGDVRFLDV